MMDISPQQLAEILAHTLKPACPVCAKLKVTRWPMVAAREGYPLNTFVGCWQVQDMKEVQVSLRKRKGLHA